MLGPGQVVEAIVGTICMVRIDGGMAATCTWVYA